MIADDPVAPLLPWYATGTLDASESAQVESHISGCDACRDLLAVAREFRRLALRVPFETLFEHVQSQRLVEFAEDPAALEPDARRFINSHIQTCPVCAEALGILEELGRAPAPAGSGVVGTAAAHRPPGRRWPAWISAWRRLGRTVLHPAPALAYLVALVIALAILPLRPPAPGGSDQLPADFPGARPLEAGHPPVPPAVPSVIVMPPAVELAGEVVFRGGGAPPAPAVIPVRAGAEGVALALITDLDREDLEDPEAAFRLEMVQGDRLAFEARRRGADFDRRGRLVLLLDPATVSAGVPCLVRIRFSRPGDRRDGEEIYRRTFILAPQGP